MKLKARMLGAVMALTAGAVGSVSADTYHYTVAGVPGVNETNDVRIHLAESNGTAVNADFLGYHADGTTNGRVGRTLVRANGSVSFTKSKLRNLSDTTKDGLNAWTIRITADGPLTISAYRIVGGDKAATLTVSERVVYTVPPAPANFAAVANTGLNVDGRIDVSWDVVDVSNIDSEVTYTLIYRTVGGPWTEERLAGTVRAWPFDGVPGTTYDFRIRADRTDGAASSTWSSIVAVQARNRSPGATGAIRVLPWLTTWGSFPSWDPELPHLATSFELQYRTSGSSADWQSVRSFERVVRSDDGEIDCGGRYSRSGDYCATSGGRGTHQARLRALRDFADPGPWSTTVTFTIR